MKTFRTLLRHTSRFHITLISLIYFPCAAFAIEPIGTIGQPFPQQHAFLSNDAIVRVVPSHIQILDANTGAVTREFGEKTYQSHVVLSPMATHLAILNRSAGPRTTVIIWDVNARKKISHWDIPSIIRVAAFSPIKPLFAASFNDEIYIWNWETGELLGEMMTPADRSHSRAMAFSADSRHLIVASEQILEIWDVETYHLKGHFEGPSINKVKNIVVSPDGTHIATIETGSDVVYVWDMETRSILWEEISGIGRISDIVFSPDSQHLYVATRTDRLSKSGDDPWIGWDDQVRVWDVKSGRQMDAFGDDFYFLDAIALSPDGKTMLLHYWDAVVLWDIETHKQLKVWSDFVHGWNDAISPDGRTFVSTSSGYIKTWDIRSQQIRLFVSADGALLRDFAISSNGEKIAIGKDPWLEVRSLQTGKVESKFRYSYGIADFAFSASGRWLAAEDWRNILVYDLENPENIQRLIPPNQAKSIGRQWITFAETDEYLVSFDQTENNRRVLSWKREGDTFVFHYMWEIPLLYKNHSSGVRIQPDGSILLALSEGTELQIWMLTPDAKQRLATLLGAGFPTHFTSEGRYLFTGQERTLQIWDWQTETQLDHPPIPDYFDVSRDGSILLSYAKTGQINIWDAKALLPSQPVAVEPKGKQIAVLGAVKRNQLLQNFPNPFNPETWIPFQLAKETDVTIHIYSPTGQVVRHLPLGTIPAGNYLSKSQGIYWDGRNQTGEPVSSGVYLYTINAGNFSETRKMLIRK